MTKQQLYDLLSQVIKETCKNDEYSQLHEEICQAILRHMVAIHVADITCLNSNRGYDNGSISFLLELLERDDYQTF